MGEPVRFEVLFDGRPLPAVSGQSVGAVLVGAGIRSWRTTRVRRRPRGLFCGIGICYDCLITVDGVPNQRPAWCRPGPVCTCPAAAPVTENRYDVVVVGAGPAGLAAAVAAAEAGRTVALVDAGAQPGGQYWRHPAEAHPHGPDGPDGSDGSDDPDGSHGSDGAESRGQHDWPSFAGLRARLRRLSARGPLTYLPGRQVWLVEKFSRTVHLTAPYGEFDGPEAVAGDALILCPGGYDRQLPIPGWDLPGVMSAGGVQALLKGHGTVAGRRVIVGGTGPFLLPVATGLARAGAHVVAVCEAGRVGGWVRHAPAAAAVPAKAREAVGYAAALARSRIPYRQRTAITAIHGDDAVRSVTLSRLDRDGRVRGRSRAVEVDLVALGWGFTPSLELVTATGAATRRDVDDSLVAVVDDCQRATVPGVYVAGEATGVGGALLAVAEGELAGLVAAGDLSPDRPPAGSAVRQLQRRIARYRRFAAAMHAVHPVPRRWHEWLRPDTVICRCEEVTAEQVTSARDELGADDARTLKLVTRTGMGWCQGRVCGFAAAKLAAAHEGRDLTADDLRPTARQPFAAPITLQELAGPTA